MYNGAILCIMPPKLFNAHVFKFTFFPIFTKSYAKCFCLSFDGYVTICEQGTLQVFVPWWQNDNFSFAKKKENRFPLFRHTWLLFAHLQSLYVLFPIALITAFTVDTCRCYVSWELFATSDKIVWERIFLIKYFLSALEKKYCERLRDRPIYNFRTNLVLLTKN